MPLSEFLRRFLSHVTAAATALFAILAVGEYLVPESVLPFLDLVDAALAVATLNVATALLVFRKTERLVSKGNPC